MVRSGKQMRGYLVDQVNNMLRRPHMFGGEPALWIAFDHLFYLEDDDFGVEDLRQSWRDRNAFTPTGLKGALQRQLPDNILVDALSSVYAETARNRGWLALDRTLTRDEYLELRKAITPFTEHDHTFTEVVDTFGPPSIRFGGSSPYYGKTLAYATADRTDPMVAFHLWNGTDPGADQDLRSVHPQPVLLAIRYGTGPFPTSFTFTPEGHRRRPQDSAG
ncbi:hypothetical protein [Nocardia wallacei]|uniref:hypothetical protein n=1 Tax=Nocardia wallacei TaxID=480035 RepID=UPI002454CCBB|nr:hypothetical protein [Nocardia wallacei]